MLEEKAFSDILKTIELIEPETIEELQHMPQDLIDFTEYARPIVDGRKRDFALAPFWRDIYQDDARNIMIVAGRQTYKTTFCTDIVAQAATSEPNVEVCYVTDSEAHLSAFSRQRFRYGTMLPNPVLKQFMRYGRANIGEVSLRNNSVVYLVTDEGEYKKVEGKSLKTLVLDEAQYQDVEFLPKAMYALFQTKGRMYILGIGGESGSEYHKLWSRTDQREWIYKHKDWRQRLRFDSSGRVVNTDLAEVLAGRWRARNPGAKYRGYHLPQTIFPSIPATIDDAVEKYRTQPDISIEHQRLYTHPSFYISHVMGDFYKAPRRPITPEMVLACMEPYRYLPLLSGAEVVKLKGMFGSEIRVLMGVDWGSTIQRSLTFASILIHWRRSKRYQLAYLENISQHYEHQLDQAARVAQLAAEYGIDLGVGDMGYGAIQNDIIRDGGRDSKDNPVAAVGRRKWIGCRTIGDEAKQHQEFKTEVDEHGKVTGRVQIDKTTAIQKFVDFVGWKVSHPLRAKEEALTRPKLMIPYADPLKVDFLIDDLCATTRKDLDKEKADKPEDPRAKARREFNHPRDSMMSLIYCLVADEHYDDKPYEVLGASRKRR